MADRELLIQINASAKKFHAELEKIESETEKLEKSLNSIARISAAGFAALTAAVAGSVIAFAQFESKFTDVVTLLDKGSFGSKNLNQGIEELRKGVLNLGAESGESFDILNKGLFDLISAGVPAGKAVQTLTVATDLAKAGATNTATAVNGLTSALNAYGLGADQAQAVSEKFFTAQKGGKTTIDELSSGFGLVGANAAALGVSLNELLSAVSAVTNGGLSTNQAYTGLKAVLANISKPTEDAAIEARRLGVEFNISALRAKGLEKFLGDLTKANGFTKDSITKLFGSVEAQSIAFALTGEQADTFRKILRNVSDESATAATFQEALAVKNENVKVAYDKLKQSVLAVAIVLGEQFAPIISAGAEVLGRIAKAISQFDDTTLRLIATVIGLATAFTGLVAGLSVGALAFLKIRAGIQALLIAFPALQGGLTALRVAFTTTWAAATLGISLLIAFLPELISGLGKVSAGLAEMKENSQDADRFLTENARNFKKLKDEIKGQEQALSDLNKQIKENGIEEGKTQGIYALTLITQKKQTEERLAQLKAEEAAIQKKRIEEERAAKAASQQKDKVKPKTDEEIQKLQEREAFERLFAGRLSEIRKQFNDVELEDFQKKIQTEAELRKAALQAEIDALIKNRNDQAAIEEEIELKILQDKLNRQLEFQRQFAENEMRFGTVLANIDAFINNEKVQGVKKVSGQLQDLMRSRNKTLFEVGKAAALANIAISTAEGAISAYKSLAGIPFIGPILGSLAAAALVAFGAEQAATVSSTQFQAAEGGVVPDTPGKGVRDRTIMALEPGEIIVPKRLTPTFKDTFGNPALAGNEGQGAGNTFVLNVETLFAENDSKVQELFQKFQELVDFNNVQPLSA